MVAQDGFGEDGKIPLRYDALGKCLLTLNDLANGAKLSVHMPRIGCGLAGGTWSEVGPLVEKSIVGVNVYVYDL
jgi:O-acetyl-ADP-ribose deacetylase (regulator of RNase III)